MAQRLSGPPRASQTSRARCPSQGRPPGMWLSEGPCSPPGWARPACSGGARCCLYRSVRSGSIGLPVRTARPNQCCQPLPSLHPISAWAGAGRLSKSMSSRRPAMSRSPTIGRKKRSPSKLDGMDVRVEAVRKTRAKRPWLAGYQGSSTSHSA